MALMESIIRANVLEALRQADEQASDQVTLSVGLLKRLWDGYDQRGEALEPFAMAADSISYQQPDTAPTVIRVTCGDLRAARAVRPR